LGREKKKKGKKGKGGNFEKRCALSTTLEKKKKEGKGKEDTTLLLFFSSPAQDHKKKEKKKKRGLGGGGISGKLASCQLLVSPSQGGEGRKRRGERINQEKRPLTIPFPSPLSIPKKKRGGREKEGRRKGF